MATTYQADFGILSSFKGRNERAAQRVGADDINLKATTPSPYDIITGKVLSLCNTVQTRSIKFLLFVKLF
jgi:hypothetical protein